MTTYVIRIWKALGSIELAIVLLLFLVADLVWGFFVLESGRSPFLPLNDVGLFEWAQTYGRVHIHYTLWFFVLLPLLFLLAINTFVCTTIRVYGLFKNRSAFAGWGRFFLKLSPHCMHYALILILLGDLSSYLLALTVPNNILTLGAGVRIRTTDYLVRLDSLDVAFKKEMRSSSRRSRAIDATARLSFTDGKGAVVHSGVISVNNPLWFKGFSLHLKDFGPQTPGGGMGGKPHVNLIVRKDPGIKLYLAGTFLFTAGLFMYVWEWIWTRFRKDERL
jgi:cytochrome c biogenesis protein ResB